MSENNNERMPFTNDLIFALVMRDPRYMQGNCRTAAS